MRFRSSQRSFVILKAAEDCCKKWRQKKWGKKEQTGKHQLTGSGSCADMKCYSEIQTKTWSSVAFQIVLLNNAIKTCHLDCLTLSTPPACLIFHRTFSSPSLLRTVCFPTLGSGGSAQQKGPREQLLISKPPDKQHRCGTVTYHVQKWFGSGRWFSWSWKSSPPQVCLNHPITVF